MKLDNDFLNRIEKLVDARVVAWQRVDGGYTPATRLLATTATARFFVKAGATPLTGEFLRREITMYNALRGDFMPRLVAWDDDNREPILIIEDLSAYHWPPPWSEAQIDIVLAQIDAMHNTQPDIETFAQAHGDLDEGWQSVTADPEPFLSLGFVTSEWLDIALPQLVEAAGRCRTDGKSLTHWDMRSDNICLIAGRAVFVDWNWACLSNPTLDLGFFLPSLAFEGGPLPDQILPDAPEVAAWVSGFFAARAGLPDIPDAPRVRLVQRQQLSTALPWVIRALDLPDIQGWLP